MLIVQHFCHQRGTTQQRAHTCRYIVCLCLCLVFSSDIMTKGLKTYSNRVKYHFLIYKTMEVVKAWNQIVE